MRIRGTPFITAVIMSAAAMVLIPAALNDRHHSTSTTPAPTGLPASPLPSTQEAGLLPSETPSSAAPPAFKVEAGPRTLRPRAVTLPVNGFWSWALLDRRTGKITGSANLTSRSDTASAIKIWLAADYLRRADENRTAVDASRQRQLSVMIRDSDNKMADAFWRANGGAASIQRMIRICGLTESRSVATGSWSTTEISARDGARLVTCVADGRGAGPHWTAWLLGEMRQVRGSGRFGIVTALTPEAATRVAIKNGWINRSDGKWHITCLAVADEWALAVQTVYPVGQGMAYGANVCKQVAVQLGTS